MSRAHIQAATIREVSVRASADPRTVERVLRGERARGMVDHRIRVVLAEMGIAVPAPSPDVMGMSFAGGAVALAGGRR